MHYCYAVWHWSAKRLTSRRSLLWALAWISLLGVLLLQAPNLGKSVSLDSRPPAQVHPLPPGLADWHSPLPNDDYFDQIRPVSVGYLVWSHFPIHVFVEPIKPEEQDIPSARQRSQAWIDAVRQALQEWSPYLPLQTVTIAQEADIAIWRMAPPLQVSFEPLVGVAPEQPQPRRRLVLGRARAAETQFELYQRPLSPDRPDRYQLAHRFKILLRPDQPPSYTLATARHELGHALGIWGHSPRPTDALYFSQVRTPPAISVRDINTLKRIYQQPTQLGWEIP